MNNKNYVFVLLSIFGCVNFSSVFSQTDTLLLKVKGKVQDTSDIHGVYNVMVVNQRTHQGVFGDYSGSFEISIKKTDTIIVASTGYSTIKISLRDSVFKPEYYLTINLKKLSYDLRQLEVFPLRDLEEIHKEIDKLGYNKSDYVLSGVDAFNSPITFLYQNFSKRERSKRLVAELENEDKRRDLLKELLARYVNGNLIKLDNDKFDDFIDYCNISEQMMKSLSQYDFIMYVKAKYEKYMREYGW
jgi:hypothetical protein